MLTDDKNIKFMSEYNILQNVNGYFFICLRLLLLI